MQLVEEEGQEHRRFRAIYRDEFAFVWAVARRFGVPPAALDDAVQDVFLTAYRRIDRLGYQVSQRAWLYAVTRKVASHHRRRDMRLARRISALQEATPDEAEVPQERHDARQALDRLLAPLPGAMREVWEMTELLGMTGPEIAAELELPLNTVYSRLRLARSQMIARAPELSAYVAAARRAEEPPPEAAQRSWAVLVPMLRPGSFAAVATAWASTRAAIATTLVAGSVVTVAVISPRPQAAQVAPVAERSPTVAASPTAIVIPRAPATAPVVAAPRRVVGSASDRLAAEVALLDQARAHITADAPGLALALLSEHARSFPDGVLHDAREAAKAEALCRLGDAEAAVAVARGLVARHTDSLLARKYEHYVCAP